jgi:hypothetical protein
MPGDEDGTRILGSLVHRHKILDKSHIHSCLAVFPHGSNVMGMHRHFTSR